MAIIKIKKVRSEIKRPATQENSFGFRFKKNRSSC